MAYSQNGYTANNRSLIASFTVPGTSRKLALRKGDTSVLLLDLAAWFHRTIETIDTGTLDDWGYAERKVRGSSSTLSNHASGTGIDLNAPRHPLGKRGTFTPAQVSAIRQRLAYYEGCIRWGGDYSNRADEMHFEIDRGAADVARVANKIRTAAAPRIEQPPVVAPAPTAGVPTLRIGNKGDAVKQLQKALGITADGDFGPATSRAVMAFQKSRGLTADGIVGQRTWDALNTPKAAPPRKVAPAPARKPAPTPVKAAPKPAPKTNPFATPVLSSRRPLLQEGIRIPVAEVRWVQWAIGATTDGKWGPQTTAAVKSFQKSKRIRQDGVIGSQTLAKLAQVRR